MKQKLTALDDALAMVMAEVAVVEPEEVALAGACGRVLAEDVVSREDVPALSRSAMDGYAVRRADCSGAARKSPAELDVAVELPAGPSPETSIGPGQAARIMTGAAMPAGADAVVMVEMTERVEGGAERVRIFHAPGAGENLSPCGEDASSGETVMARGQVLTPPAVAFLATLGRARVQVSRRPDVAVLSTGDELVDPESEPRRGQVRDANSYSLAALVSSCGCTAERLGIAADRKEQLLAMLGDGLSRDVLLVSGGVSVGDYDMVRDMLLESRVEARFWKIAMKPAKPTFFGVGPPGKSGQGRRCLVFGLPGYPVSSIVAFEQVVRPALMALQGACGSGPLVVRAVLAEDFRKKRGRTNFVRVRLEKEPGRLVARVSGPQQSSRLRSFLGARGFMVVPGEVEELAAGDEVDVEILGWAL